MAKSLRSKAKRSFRAHKRTDSVYAATEAARLNRLNAKLKDTISKDTDGDIQVEDLPSAEDNTPAVENDLTAPDGGMDVDGDSSKEKEKPISTHGPRKSRRVEWRESKGMVARPSKGVNRQGIAVAKRRAGRPSRRR